MDPNHREWQLEEARAVEVMEKIEQRIIPLQEEMGTVKREVVDLRREFWDDVKVNLDDVNEAIETHASLKQQAEVMAERERRHLHAAQQLDVWKRMAQSPYFARIDFREEGEAEAERVYIGIGSFRDKDDNFLVYDWRAPVSSLYYDYSPGPAHYETPVGRLSGEMGLKRQFIITEGRFRGMFDTGLTIGDELLRQILSRPSSAHLKSIVATIQREQNRIIRNEQKRLMVVTGPAGSGKTSTALQRIAYLLYRYRDTLQADEIVLFSPNPMFNRYVSTVLPELGERNMRQTTYQEYVEYRLADSFRLEHPAEQMEYALSAGEQPEYAARMEGIRYKAGAAFFRVLGRYVERLGQEGMRFRDLRFQDRTLISGEAMLRQFYELDASLSIPNRLSQIAEWLRGELVAAARREREADWVEEEIELLDNEDYVRAFQELQRRHRYTEETFDDFDREREWLARQIVNERFKPLRADIKRFRFVDMPAIYTQLFASPDIAASLAGEEGLPERWADICALTAERMNRGEMAVEDATPYLYLNECLEGFHTNTSIRHVFVDEGQDYGVFQLHFLKRLFPRARFTVLGDEDQAIYPHAEGAAAVPLPALAEVFPAEETESFQLTRSYRSTRPIMELARRIIPGGERIDTFEREGPAPTLTGMQDREELNARVAARMRELLAAGHRNVALLCTTAQESREAYEALRDLMPLRLVHQETVTFEAGALVIPSYLAKGVEFDAVVLYNASDEGYGRESERKLLYVACTRAMHELHIYYMGRPSPWLEGALAGADEGQAQA
ncbi:RNA polymerase recycling motor HelD [Paenibacillus dendritiformis]|uniref:RNA polymerase recycling motor HelD n=1 Tax=Paenibacillus dendritiformis TaxID=130049 RepID=UPI000DA83CEA|nr:RNA polymerase recycling motor HelD [Paenibacillus dendritiformis]PZM64083.1 helicase [Paenibacillus dendritiformis]